MSSITRQPILRRQKEPHPVDTMLTQAEASPETPAAQQPAPAPAAAPEPPQAAPAQQPEVAQEPAQPARPTGNATQPSYLQESQPTALKQQVNYRLDPAVIKTIKQASIDYSYRQGQRISQSQLVELALQDWLDRNGPWGH